MKKFFCKKFVFSIGAAAVIAVAAVNVSVGVRGESLSDLVLANIEALARIEDGEWGNGCYTDYSNSPYYDSDGNLIGSFLNIFCVEGDDSICRNGLVWRLYTGSSTGYSEVVVYMDDVNCK